MASPVLVFLREVLPAACAPPNVGTRLLPEAPTQPNSPSRSPKFPKPTGTIGGWKEEELLGMSRQNARPMGFPLEACLQYGV